MNPRDRSCIVHSQELLLQSPEIPVWAMHSISALATKARQVVLNVEHISHGPWPDPSGPWLDPSGPRPDRVTCQRGSGW